MRNGKKLTRSKKDQKFLGVCAGIAEYFDIDPILVRAFWAVLVFVFGTGILLYFVLAFIMGDGE